MAGGWLLVTWSGDQALLDDKLSDRDSDGNVVGISHEAYGAEQDRIDRLGVGGTALLGVGAVAAALGGWRLATHKQPASASAALQLQPSWNGSQLTLTGRF